MARLTLHHAPRHVTGNPAGNLPADLDRIDRRARAAADDFIRRDAGNLALHAGLSQHTISRQREYEPDLVPALAKVARIVAAGLAIGRTFDDVAAFLAPVTEAARGDLAPRLEIAGEIGDLHHTLAGAIREGADSEAAVADLLDGATADELETAESETVESITAHQRMLAAIRARKAPNHRAHGLA